MNFINGIITIWLNRSYCGDDLVLGLSDLRLGFEF